MKEVADSSDQRYSIYGLRTRKGVEWSADHFQIHNETSCMDSFIKRVCWKKFWSQTLLVTRHNGAVRQNARTRQRDLNANFV